MNEGHYKKLTKFALNGAREYWEPMCARNHTTEMRMLRWARGKTRLDYVRNVYIRKMSHMAEFLREKTLRWFAHVQRRDKDEAMRNILHKPVTVDGKRNQGS